MAMWKILTVACASWVLAESKYHHHKREATISICDTLANSTNKIQCYCTRNSLKPEQIKYAECFLTKEIIDADDPSWNGFSMLRDVSKITVTNTKGIPLKYIPTKAIAHTKALTKLTIKYGNIERVQAFAFANSSQLYEIIVRDNNIKVLERHAFAHHKNVSSISLDTNDIEEINRDVFVDLPTLQKLFLTGNKITTIHDRAFVHLRSLRELEIDKNKLFSLNSETFSGLRELTRLDLSSNSLEVIGANTFVHLVDLQSLNLDGNQIEMLDEKSFNGLGKLQALSLAHNKLTEIDNVNTFTGLSNLKTLSLKENKLIKLKSDVIDPIINNFYGPFSFLDFEGNRFPCDCNLDWFLLIKNNTQNNILKNSLSNVKCNPSDSVRESWKKFTESDKNEDEMFEEEQPAQNAEYEYYDDSQLNGTLFYTDIRFLLNCTTTTSITSTDVHGSQPTEKIVTTKANSSPATTPKPVTITTTKPFISTTQPKSSNINQGLLDLSVVETTTQTTEAPKTITDNLRKVDSSDKNQHNDRKMSPTTSRLATVSAKPIDKSYDERDMASDEAKPDKMKVHRNYQEEIKATQSKINNAQRNIGCVSMLAIIIMLSLRSFL